MTTRRRRVQETSTAKPLSIGRAFSKLDFFKKTKKQFVEGSSTGGIATFVIISVLVLLTLNEWRLYWPLRREDTMSVDSQVQESVEIFFNITFPNVKCNKLHVDVVDVSGEAQINVGQNIVKNAVAEDGRIIAMGRESEKNKYRTGTRLDIDDPLSPEYCGVCFDRKYNKGKCCNHCEDVINRLRELHVPIPAKTEIYQCVNEISTMYQGCNMYGALTVSKVTGNFHFAPGQSFSSDNGRRVSHIHEFDPRMKFDCSHVINELRFGRKDDVSIIRNPLDDSQVLVNDTTIHKYFVKVVPTTIKYPIWVYDYEAFQYSYTEHSHHYTNEAIKMPGIFFIYDFSPIRVTYRHFRPPLFGFVVTLAGVIGGLWAVSQFVNSFYRDAVEQFLRKKHD